MKTKHQYLLLFFWTALLADCYLIYSQQPDYRMITKGALMPLLLLYYLGNASRRHHLPSKILTTVALLLAWGGDLFLLQSGQQFFIIGLGLFLAMHVVYSIYFWRVHALFPIKQGIHVLLPLAIAAVLGAVVMSKIYESAAEEGLAVPLLAYLGVISFMFVLAFNILGSKKSKSLATNYFIPGAGLFLVSDAVLGVNMFLWEDHLIGIVVMLTYGYAQHLLVHGFIKHVKGRV